MAHARDLDKLAIGGANDLEVLREWCMIHASLAADRGHASIARYADDFAQVLGSFLVAPAVSDKEVLPAALGAAEVEAAYDYGRILPRSYGIRMFELVGPILLTELRGHVQIRGYRRCQRRLDAYLERGQAFVRVVVLETALFDPSVLLEHRRWSLANAEALSELELGVAYVVRSRQIQRSIDRFNVLCGAKNLNQAGFDSVFAALEWAHWLSARPSDSGGVLH